MPSSAPLSISLGHYDPALVALSVLLAIFAAWTALLNAGSIERSREAGTRALGFAGGSIALGGGIWAMHFVGMLASHAGSGATYSASVTVASLLPGLVAASAAMAIVHTQAPGTFRLLLGGAVFGLGIAGMHYTGMSAMQVAGKVHYHAGMVALSIGVAVLLATLALGIPCRLRRAGRIPTGLPRLASAVAMGLAVSATHYLGMAAARMDMPAHASVADGPSNAAFLAVAVALATLAFTSLVIAINGFLRYRELFTELRDNEARQRALLDTAIDGVITIAADGTISAFNPSAERLFLWTRDEILGQPAERLIAGPYRAKLADYLARTLRGRTTDGVNGREVMAERKDGSRLPIRLAIGHTHVGGRDLFVAFVTDISARKDIERALRSSEQQFRSLIGNLPGIAYRSLVTPGYPMVFISESVERLTGYAAADFLATPPRVLFGDLIHPDDTAHVDAEVTRALVDGQPFQVEYRLRHRNGEWRWMWENGSAVPDDGPGAPRRLDGVILDITARKAADIDVHRFRAIVASSEDAIISKDLNGVITTWNRGAQLLFGFRADEVIGQSMQILFPPDRLDEEPLILARLARGERVHHFETVRRTKDGDLIDVSATISPILDERNRVIGASQISRDISERKRMEAALRDAKEHAELAAAARTAFLANMSHEIRTPMNAVLGFTDVLLQGRLDDEQRRHLDTVRSSARSLLRLLNEILDTAKLDRGLVDLETNEFNLLSLIDELSSTMGASARDKGLSLHIRYDDGLPGVFLGDELRVRQVLTNLLGNAIKFTAKGSVTLSVEAEGDLLHFQVADTGIGIPTHRLAAIFDPFTQADASMSRRFGGTGLGTTISKQLVELMGGRISVDSTVDVGSTFHVWLPLAAVDEAPAACDAPRRAVPLPPLRILLADDVPQNLELLALLLEDQGHTVGTASDGLEAVRLATRERFDVILMDVQMPGMDGLEATRRLRIEQALASEPATPVIALTASVMDADRDAARKAGMDGFASKPVDFHALSMEIARLLRLYPARATALPARLPDPAVLDTAGGIARWTGQEAFYRRTLRRFGHEQHGLAATLTDLHQRRDRPGLRALAHRIRGLAANLGLDRLAALLQGVDEAIADGDEARASALLADLPAQLDAALQAIQDALGDADRTPPAAPAQPATPLDLPRVTGLVKTLSAGMRRGQLDAAHLDGLMTLMAGHVDRPALARLQYLTDNFDFASAAAELDALLERLSAPHEDAS
ncbi:PAS domain S-box protein [Pigmentiphaga litoralis]|uniref:Virulence sensor protein BvgS n=1 Tax=Pigmentiphaga litoralis TaxID=516702 RepID=A0A7Y9IU83_9BURK|nr:PAS domain S-box protein [Pigmentiphaga litoralis]NYE23265.1 PAS domain S-box-containing protein [Pigmentiphaga litoralis]NYE83121.1 PAS domain S-box-containing protein [Pigmentiphaga litoralis]